MHVVAIIVRECDQLDHQKPTVVKHDIHIEFVKSNGKGDVLIQSARYKTRMQRTNFDQVRHNLFTSPRILHSSLDCSTFTSSPLDPLKPFTGPLRR